jgi:hypothetical protein
MIEWVEVEIKISKILAPFFDAANFGNLHLDYNSSNQDEIFHRQIVLLNRVKRIFSDFYSIKAARTRTWLIHSRLSRVMHLIAS